MANTPSKIDFSIRPSDFLAQVISDGTYNDVVQVMKNDQDPASATEIQEYSGQLWSNVIDDMFLASWQVHYKAQKTWAVATNAEMIALGSDDGLQVNDLAFREDTKESWYCVSVDGPISSTWTQVTVGAGDVMGPASSIAGNIATFADISGKIIEDSGFKPGDFLLLDGSTPMTGDLNMNGNEILNVGDINGVDITDHVARHMPGGADPLPIDTPVSVSGQSNNPGTGDAFATANHQHALHYSVWKNSTPFLTTSSAMDFRDDDDIEWQTSPLSSYIAQISGRVVSIRDGANTQLTFGTLVEPNTLVRRGTEIVSEGVSHNPLTYNFNASATDSDPGVGRWGVTAGVGTRIHVFSKTEALNWTASDSVWLNLQPGTRFISRQKDAANTASAVWEVVEQPTDQGAYIRVVAREITASVIPQDGKDIGFEILDAGKEASTQYIAVTGAQSDADPGAGRFALNATVASASELYVSYTDALGCIIPSPWARITQGSLIVARRKFSPSTHYFVFEVVDDATDNTSYATVPLSFKEASGVDLVDSEHYFFEIWPSPAPPQISGSRPWSFNNSVTMADPGTGNFRVNNADLSLVTEMAISKTDDDNNDAALFLSFLKENFEFLHSQQDDTTRGFSGVIGVPVDEGTWYRVPVTSVEDVGSGGLFQNNRTCNLYFQGGGGGGGSGDTDVPSVSVVMDSNANGIGASPSAPKYNGEQNSSQIYDPTVFDINIGSSTAPVEVLVHGVYAIIAANGWYIASGQGTLPLVKGWIEAGGVSYESNGGAEDRSNDSGDMTIVAIVEIDPAVNGDIAVYHTMSGASGFFVQGKCILTVKLLKRL